MEHIRDIELIEFVAGHLDSDRAAAVRAHGEHCPECALKLRELGRTWNLLGAWEVATAQPGPDRAMPAAAPDRAPAIWRLGPRQISVALRIAAAVAVVAGAGYGMGRWTARPTRSQASTDAPRYLSILASDMTDSLSRLILLDESAAGEGM